MKYETLSIYHQAMVNTVKFDSMSKDYIIMVISLNLKTNKQIFEMFLELERKLKTWNPSN